MAPGLQTAGGGRLQRKTVKSRGLPEGRGNQGGTGDGGNRGYVGVLPTVTALMVPGREDVEHDPRGEGGEVPDGLYPGDGSLYLLECVRPGPQA